MALFGIGKKKESSENSCSCGVCGCHAQAETSGAQGERGIKVLGSGCAKCNALEAATIAALAELGIAETVAHVTDFAQIASYGVMRTPALVVDGKVVISGAVLNAAEIGKLIKAARGKDAQ